jgi:hypothetical protein
MKVLCVNNDNVGLSITVGKWYRVADPKVYTEHFKDGKFILCDDKDRWITISQKYFKNIQQIREEKLNELGI